MLERLQIQNFQAHERLRIDFDPGITCIVGPSDVGKSAILRALRWVATNQPGGDAFVRHGSKGASVRLVVDGKTIKRRRTPGGSVNEYALDDKEFKAFGRGVPEPIEALLGMADVCWQGQHDAPFWFADSPGEVSRQLNSVVDLSVIDDTLAGVARALHRARTKFEMAEEDLSEAKAEADGLAWAVDFDKAVAVVETAEQAHKDKAAQAAQVATLVRDAQTHRAAHDVAARAALAGQAAGKAATAARDLGKQAATVRNLVETAIKLEGEIQAVPSFEAVEAAYKAHHTVSARHSSLLALIADIEQKEKALCQANEARKAAVAAMPELCPVCGQSL